MCILPNFSKTYQQAAEFNWVHRIQWYKVKRSLYRPLGLQEVEVHRISRVVRLSALSTSHLYATRNIPDIHFC
jgi:hypothetical protein